MAFRFLKSSQPLLRVVREGAVRSAVQRRSLHIHEADSIDLLRRFGIKTARGARAYSVEEAVAVADSLGSPKCVIKAQVLAGGRGKGVFDNGFKGGVRVVSGEKEIRDVTSSMIGHNLITKQTDAKGRPCNMVQVVEALDIAHEYYFALLMDRSMNGPTIVCSPRGGTDIEAVAHEDPSAIHKIPVDVKIGLTKDIAETAARKMGFPEACVEKAAGEMMKLYSLFIQHDCTLVEINPMIHDNAMDVKCLDAKVNFDDNAEFRQKDIFALRDTSQENAVDVEASKYNLNFIGLEGSIGCLVNGAGLAMATMDIIELYHGKPANFLDVGGGATAEQVTAAFKLITKDPQVTAILVNIFGGIMRCDVIAQGIISATKQLDLSVPVVVRLQGTMKDEAKKLIESSGLPIIAADNLDDAAQRAVLVSKIVEMARSADLAVSIREKPKTNQAKKEKEILIQML